jgi:hypothetical protein
MPKNQVKCSFALRESAQSFLWETLADRSNPETSAFIVSQGRILGTAKPDNFAHGMSKCDPEFQ